MNENHGIQELEKVSDLSLVLNGGSDTMDGATKARIFRPYEE